MVSRDLNELAQILMPSPRMPVLFVGHGNPMNAIEDNGFTQNWHKIGQKLPKAQALVVISAHWLTRGTKITDAPKNEVIYDFYGFPKKLYEVSYPTVGSHRVASSIQNQILQYEAALDSTWGLDHGTWSVLKHLAPKPEVPILQISLDINQTLGELVELFTTLKKLRKKGVIFIGSGNIVHGLQYLRFDGKTHDWALEFDDLTAKMITDKNLNQLINPRKISKAAMYAVPTDDHYRPMLAALALLEQNENLNFFNQQIDLGSVGMRSFYSVS